MIAAFNEEALRKAQARVAAAAKKFNPLGRPADSSCACLRWPCPCVCHKYAANRAKEK